jgi:hypothetical protein
LRYNLNIADLCCGIYTDLSYFWIVEPQIKSGYPHIHAGYFTEFTNNEKYRLKAHWSDVIKAGDFEHGLDFSFGSTHQTGDITSLRNYLMKYMGKTFADGMKDWTSEELVFNAIAWKEGYRFFGCSRDLSSAMKRPRKDTSTYTCLSTTMHCSDLGYENDILVWKNPTWKIIE